MPDSGEPRVEEPNMPPEHMRHVSDIQNIWETEAEKGEEDNSKHEKHVKYWLFEEELYSLSDWLSDNSVSPWEVIGSMVRVVRS